MREINFLEHKNAEECNDCVQIVMTFLFIQNHIVRENTNTMSASNKLSMTSICSDKSKALFFKLVPICKPLNQRLWIHHSKLKQKK